jgi:hypothetical protein
MDRLMEIVGELTEKKQKLLTAADRKKIPKIGTQGEVEDPIAYVRFFHAYGHGTWM